MLDILIQIEVNHLLMYVLGLIIDGILNHNLKMSNLIMYN